MQTLEATNGSKVKQSLKRLTDLCWVLFVLLNLGEGIKLYSRNLDILMSNIMNLTISNRNAICKRQQEGCSLELLLPKRRTWGKKTLLVLHLTLGIYFGRTFQQRMSLTLLTTLTSELQRIVCSRNYGRHCMIQFFRLYLEYIIDVQCVNF